MEEIPMAGSMNRCCSTSAAERALGVSQNYVRILIHRGRLNAVSTPLGYLIERDDLEALAAKRRCPASALRGKGAR
jgi:excisionase family DNA binding protein